MHRAGRDSAVVEDAVALSLVREGMVGATSQVRRETVLERGSAGVQSSPRGSLRALDHPLGPGEPYAPYLLLRECSLHDAPEVGSFVDAQDLLVRYRAWYAHLPWRADTSRRDPLAQQRVLDHRETVSLWQGEHEMVAVENLQTLPSRVSMQRD